MRVSERLEGAVPDVWHDNNLLFDDASEPSPGLHDATFRRFTVSLDGDDRDHLGPGDD